MTFDLIEVRVGTGKNGMPASARLTKMRGSRRPACHVSITKEFAAKIEAKGGERFELLIGTGEHRGFLRLRRRANGLAIARTMRGGDLHFNLGYIDRYPAEPHDKENCEAEVVDADTIQIVMPAWADDKPSGKPASFALLPKRDEVRARKERLGLR